MLNRILDRNAVVQKKILDRVIVFERMIKEKEWNSWEKAMAQNVSAERKKSWRIYLELNARMPVIVDLNARKLAIELNNAFCSRMIKVRALFSFDGLRRALIKKIKKSSFLLIFLLTRRILCVIYRLCMCMACCFIFIRSHVVRIYNDKEIYHVIIIIFEFESTATAKGF